MKGNGISEKLFFVLRLGMVMCFIGHGIFGLITKAVWCNYFQVFGIGQDAAYRIMPWLGLADIIMGLSLLIYPVLGIVCWLFIWGLITAALRPLSGESFAELIERAGNFGVPAAFLILCIADQHSYRIPLQKLSPPTRIGDKTQKRIFLVLRCTVFLLFLGHGWLNLIEKPGLIAQYKGLGFEETLILARYLGGFEILAAVIILIYPSRVFLIFVIAWKMGTELFYPHYEIFEWIERGGSYAAIISLWLCLDWRPSASNIKVFATEE